MRDAVIVSGNWRLYESLANERRNNDCGVFPVIHYHTSGHDSSVRGDSSSQSVIAVCTVHIHDKLTQLCGGDTLCDTVQITAPALGQHTATVSQ